MGLKAFLYNIKRTIAHKKAVDRAVATFLKHLHIDVDVKRDIALAIYLTYTDVEETTEDETSTLSYIPYLGAIVAIQESIAQAAPEYDILDDKFEALQADFFGPQCQGRHATYTNKEHGLIPRCDVTTKALVKQNVVEQLNHKTKL